MKNKIIEKRPGKWPSYWDPQNIENYQEYFIKGTNIKLGYTCYNKDEEEIEYCCIISELEDDFDFYDTEQKLLKHFEWMLMNENLGWRYFQ